VTAIVGTVIYPVVIPENIKPSPAGIVYTLLSADREPVLDAQSALHLTKSRITVDLVSESFSQLRTLRNAIVSAMQFQRGTVAGFQVNAVMPAFEGAVTFDPALNLFHRPLDFTLFIHQ
jgi:hypothetical protein